MKALTKVLESLDLVRIISLWIMLVLICALAYYSLSFTNHPLLNRNEPLGTDVSGLGNAVYFSFITATTIGYGDIAPQGLSKTIVVIEAIASIILLGTFIGKMVSVKQEEIIHEVEELGAEEECNNSIAALYMFRSQLSSIDLKRKNSGKELDNALSELTIRLSCLKKATQPHLEDRKQALMRIELISNSINFSLSKLVELLEQLSKSRIDWKKESITATYAECQRIARTLYEEYNALKSEESAHVEEKLEDLNKTLTALQKSIQAP